MYKAGKLVQNLVVPGARERLGAWLQLAYTARGLTTSAQVYRSTAAAAEPFLNGSSSVYVEEMYNAWLADPKSVHPVSCFI